MTRPVTSAAARHANTVRGPSPRHVWQYLSTNVDRCERCGSHYHRIADGAHGAFYCAPTPAWLQSHPNDDRKER